MLEVLSIDGFKSFRNFRLELRPGLNVIAGPNGSGKTNIIKFFEFLSHLASGSLVEAVSRAGGAGAIFRQARVGRFSGSIRFALKGQSSFRDRERKEALSRFLYDYSAIIEISSENNLVFFSQQELKISGLNEDSVKPAPKNNDARSPKNKRDAVHIAWSLDPNAGAVLDIAELGGAFARSGIFAPGRRPELVDGLQKEAKDEFKNISLFTFFRHFLEPLHAITRDLLSGRSYNIDPNIVRSSEDIASEPGIKPNGGGLAATLHAAKAALMPTYGYPRFFFGGPPTRYDRNLLSNLINYSKLVNSDIHDIDVESDPFENRLRIFLQIAYEGGELRLPLSLVSDGTAKWLSLVAAVLTNTAIFAIEEPENFLHPFMQREIVDIVRNSCSSLVDPTYAIITTHSETLINCVRPDELIILSMKDGATRAVRPVNADQLRKEIAETGFGLGYYYLAGAVE